MPSTTRGFRYPAAGDAPDGPTQIHNLASDVQDELDGTLVVGGLTVGTTPFADLLNAYKAVRSFSAQASAGTLTAAATYLIGGDYATSAVLLSSGGGASAAVVYLDPADYAIAGRTTKYRLRVSYTTNGTQSGRTATFGLYPVSAVLSGVTTLGAVTAGSTVAFANPAIQTLSQGNSGDFTAPAAGYYAVGIANSGAWTASAIHQVAVQLQVRQV